MNFGKTFLAALLACIVAMILNLILFFMLIAAIASSGSSNDVAPVVMANTVLKIDLSQPIGERTQEGLSSDLGLPFMSVPQASTGIYDAIRAIEKAAGDNNISMILLTDKGTVNCGISHLEELREALAKFHDSGKPIVAYGMNYSLGGYYLASVSDKVYMHNYGVLSITGLGASLMFYKDMLDKLGVNFQLIRHGKFKAAAEQYIKNDISPENRQQNEEMLHSVWESWSEQICSSRDIDAVTFNNAVDSLKIGTSESAKAIGLIDEVLTTEQYKEKICTLTGVEKEEDLNVIQLSSYVKTLPFKSKGEVKVAVLYAEGQIAMNGDGIVADKFVREAEKIRKDKSIDAVVLRVNSPGGDAQAAEIMREALQDISKEKPIVCSFGDYAASGGYWISAQANRIFADKTTLTGSIGVFSIAINYGKGLKEHLKVNSVQLGTHRHSNMGDMSKGLDNEEVDYAQKLVEQTYTRFMNIVSEGRKMSVAEVDSIAQGRVWTGRQGVNIGIVDEIGGLEDAIKYAAYLAINGKGGAAPPQDDFRSIESHRYKVVEYPKVKTSLEVFMERFGAGSEETLLKKIFGEKTVSQAEQILEEFKRNNGIITYARIPYTYEFKY